MARCRAPEAGRSALSLMKIMCTLLLAGVLLSALALALPRGRTSQSLAFGVYALAVVASICFAVDGDFSGTPPSKKDNKSAKKRMIEVAPAPTLFQNVSAHAAPVYQRLGAFFRVLELYLVASVREMVLLLSVVLICGASIWVIVVVSEELFALASAWHPTVVAYFSTHLLPTAAAIATSTATTCAHLSDVLATVHTAVDSYIVPQVMLAIVTITAAAIAACNYLLHFSMMVVVIVVIVAALVMVLALFVHHALDTVFRLRFVVVTPDHHTPTRRVDANVGTHDMDTDASTSDLGARVDDLRTHAGASMRGVPGDIRDCNPSSVRVLDGDTETELSADECAIVWRWCHEGAARNANTTDAVTLRKLHRCLLRMGLLDPLVPTASSGDVSGGSTESDVDLHTGNASGSTEDDENNGGNAQESNGTDYADERVTHDTNTVKAPAPVVSIAAAAQAGIQAVVQLASVLHSVPKRVASGLHPANPREQAHTHTPATQADVRARKPSDIRHSLTSPPTHAGAPVEVRQQRIQDLRPPVHAPTTTLTDVSNSLPQHQLQPQQPRILSPIDELNGSETPPPSQQSPQAHTPTPAPVHASIEENLLQPQESQRQLQAPPPTSTPAGPPVSANESSRPLQSEHQAPAQHPAAAPSPTDGNATPPQQQQQSQQQQQPQQPEQQQQPQQPHLQQQEHVHAPPERKPPARRRPAVARRAQRPAGPPGINPNAWKKLNQLGAKPTTPKQGLVARNGGVVFADDIFTEDITTILSDAHRQDHRHKARCLLMVVNKRASLQNLESHKEPHLVAAESFLAKGGFGAAYKCGPDQGHPHLCALKLVKYVVHEDDGSLVTVDRGLQHFDLAYQEGQILHELRDEPNVATLHDMAHIQGCVYLRMELGTNGTLHGKRFVYPAWVYMSASMVSQYLRCGRRGIFHRDLKPSNVIMCDFTPKFIDFGIAKRIQPVALEAGGAWEMEILNDGKWGTPDYQAPEIKAGLPYTAAADAYSIGKLLQEIRGRFTPAQDDRADTLIKALCHDDQNQRACTFAPMVQIFADLQTDTDWKVDIEEFLNGGFQPPVESLKASLGLP